jgi:DNA-binding transcriptional LysR family regulator
MDWDHLRFVLAAGRAGTLAGAARRLGVDQTTVGRRLAAAEAALGARLFDRVAGRLRPTATGLAALARAERMERAAADLAGDLAGAGGGSVRLTAVPLLANRLLVPALPALVAARPGLRLELLAEPRNLNLTRREADLALRLARPQQGGGTLARRIGRLDYAVYGPRGGHAGRRGAAPLPWIGYEEGLAHLPPARWLATAEGPRAALAVQDAETLWQALLAGLGRSLLPCRLAEGEPRLRRLDPGVALSREVWLLRHADQRGEPAVEAAVAWLEGLFASG